MVLISPLVLDNIIHPERPALSVGLRIQLFVMLDHVETASESSCIARISALGT